MIAAGYSAKESYSLARRAIWAARRCFGEAYEVGPGSRGLRASEGMDGVIYLIQAMKWREQARELRREERDGYA